jgi:hypothetical protein
MGSQDPPGYIQIMSSSSAVPAYYEESWAILSTIGLVNILFGFMVIGITTLSPISIVPIVVSVAGAIANGLCYYAFYADYPTTGTVVAAAFADITWLVGDTCYGNLIPAKIIDIGSRSGIIILQLPDPDTSPPKSKSRHIHVPLLDNHDYPLDNSYLYSR